jgi:polyphosphate kinase
MSTVKEPMKRKDYEKALRKLQVELCALQDWVKQKGLRVVVVFEGRDAAGKGGSRSCTCNATCNISPRRARSWSLIAVGTIGPAWSM